MTPPGSLVQKTSVSPFIKRKRGSPSIVIWVLTLGLFAWVLTRALDLSMLAWLSVNSLNRNHTKAQLHLLSWLSFVYQETDLNILIKPDRPLCESRCIWANRQDQIHWDNCHGTEGLSYLMVPMELSGIGPLRGMQSLIAHIITHPAILIRSCIGMCLYTITLISLHIQNIPLSGMAVACLCHSHSSN